MAYSRRIVLEVEIMVLTGKEIPFVVWVPIPNHTRFMSRRKRIRILRKVCIAGSIGERYLSGD